MTGLMVVTDPPDEGHLRLEICLQDRRQPQSIWFWDQRGLGTLTLFEPGELEATLLTGRLGPDALEVDEAGWLTLCARTARPIKVALLDQKLIAGIGNLYASEMLHAARISPRRQANRLTRGEVLRLRAACLAILEEAIRYEGSTLSDGTYRNALNQNGGYQNEHRVYDRAGELCPTCREVPIERIVQAQRSTFFCPVCQCGPNRRRGKPSHTTDRHP